MGRQTGRLRSPFLLDLKCLVHIDKYSTMIDMYTKKQTLTEGKYGYKFDQFKPPFKNEGKYVVDNSGRQLGEFKNADLAKEMASILSDLPKIREAAERIATIWR